MDGLKTNQKKLEYNRAYNRELRAWLKSNKLCIVCGEMDAFTMVGRSLCADCADSANERIKKAYAAGYRTKRLAQAKEHREKRRVSGLCTRCGGKRQNEKYKLCEECRREARRYYQKHKVENGHYTRELGICYLCNREPELPGYRTCAACHQKMVKVIARNAKFNNRENHPWKKIRFGKGERDNAGDPDKI